MDSILAYKKATCILEHWDKPWAWTITSSLIGGQRTKPHIFQKQGLLHFTIRLKFEIFGVSSINLKINLIYVLEEVHRPGGKYSNELCSMICNALMYPRNHTGNWGWWVLKMTANNCAGQNKNRLMVWYLAWRCILGFEDKITLQFLVTGHTTNCWDSYFGLCKTVAEGNGCVNTWIYGEKISKTSPSTDVVWSRNVCWLKFENYLHQFFKIPKGFKISASHLHDFDSKTVYMLFWKNYLYALSGLNLIC